MSWSTMVQGDKAAVRKRVEEDLERYRAGYAKRGEDGDECSAAEAVQVEEAKATILGQIDRTDHPYIKVEASGSHGSSWSNTRLSVDCLNLTMSE